LIKLTKKFLEKKRKKKKKIRISKVNKKLIKIMKSKSHSLVGIIMGSKSDWTGTMEYCSDTLKQFRIKHDVRVISAHRTPKRLHKFLKESEKNKMEIIIAAAGMSAHLAGVTASLTTLPVLGVPIESKLKGLDSLLSTVQMPSGIPVGTLAIGKAGAINAALLAISILSVRYKKIEIKLKKYRNNFEKKVPKKPF